MTEKYFQKLLKKYIIDIGFISLAVNQIRLQEAVDMNNQSVDWFLDYEQTKKSITFAEETWRNIEKNLDLNFNKQAIENMIFLIDKALGKVAETLLFLQKVKTQNEKAILVFLSGAQNNLMFLKEYFTSLLEDV